jgi:hypothetical protein
MWQLNCICYKISASVKSLNFSPRNLLFSLSRFTTISMVRPRWLGQVQGCQIFRGTIHQNVENIPKCHKIYQMAGKLTYIIAIKYTSIFHCKTLPNLSFLGFLVWKYTIWQPCRNVVNVGGFFGPRNLLRLTKDRIPEGDFIQILTRSSNILI